MRRNARCLAVLGGSAVLILALSIPAPAQERLSSLAQVFSKGYLLQDRNDDGVVDFVALAIIAPREATAADAAILADIGARLGFETMGLDVPLVFTDSDPALPETPYVLLIGSKNRWIQRLVGEGRLDLAPLSPGEGMLALLPSALEGRAALVIVGRDDDGLREAGHVFAARMPYLWRVGRETVRQIEEEAAAFFERNGLGRPSVAARTIMVRRGAEEIASVLLEVSFGRAAEVLQAAERLRELAAAHERRQREDVLNYASVARLIFELRAGAEAQRVEVPRSGTPKRDPLPLVRESREPARELSLANIYSTEGLLKGSPTELIPNRVFGLGLPLVEVHDVGEKTRQELRLIEIPELLRISDDPFIRHAPAVHIGHDPSRRHPNRFVVGELPKERQDHELRIEIALIEKTPRAIEDFKVIDRALGRSGLLEDDRIHGEP